MSTIGEYIQDLKVARDAGDYIATRAMFEIERLFDVIEAIGTEFYFTTKRGVELEIDGETWADLQQIMADYRE